MDPADPNNTQGLKDKAAQEFMIMNSLTWLTQLNLTRLTVAD